LVMPVVPVVSLFLDSNFLAAAFIVVLVFTLELLAGWDSLRDLSNAASLSICYSRVGVLSCMLIYWTMSL
jgi:hypothetical protein